MPTDETASRLHTRPSLLMRIRDHADAAAWSEFVGIYGPVVYGYCRRRDMQDSDAADVTQEVLLQVSKSIRSFEYAPERGRFRGWLGAVTASKINRLVRKLPRGRANDAAAGPPESLPEDATGDVDPVWIDEFDAEILRVALERIRPQFEPLTWRAFELVWIEDRPAPEVARELGRPTYTVYQAKSRVLARLREEIVALAADVPLFEPLR